MGNNYKEDFLAQMKWIGANSRGHKNLGSDITITRLSTKPTKAGLVRPRMSITMRNDVHEMISSTGFFVLCQHKNRILFKESKSSEGYKMGTSNGSKGTYTQITVDSEEWFAFVGDYELKYDDFLELYYIEKEG